MAIPNSDRLAALFEGRFDALRALARILKDSSVSIVVGQQDETGPLHEMFDYVFEVQATGLDSWREGSLVCQRARIPGSKSAGVRVSLADLPWAADVLTLASNLGR